jgi:uncharacterized protein YhaN
MIIKELTIKAFGKLENYKLSLDDGINIVYGENEKGKSTIETFIKVMLYGFSKKKLNGETERKRYLPFSGSTVQGEIIIEYQGIQYIIIRSFGNTKKEDSSVILEALTGQEAAWVNYEEPGKSFLGINRATFEKTLFVNQLGVAFTKDKEEEIMDKITAIFGCGQEEVPVVKAVERLEGLKRELTTSRGVGALDLLKKREADLLIERYQAYNLAEQNLEWENELFSKKEKREQIKKEINNLEIYKKYLKKLKLQKEYREIKEYLKKSEELKQKEQKVQNELACGEKIIDQEFLNKLKEDNRVYLNILDKINELNLEIDNLSEQNKKIIDEVDKYRFIELFGDNLKDKLTKVNYEQQIIKERLSYLNRIKQDIDDEEKELSIKASETGRLGEYSDEKREDIEELFASYELKLHQLKYIAEKNHINYSYKSMAKKARIKLIISIAILFCGGTVGVMLAMPIKLASIPIIIIGAILLINSGISLISLEKQRLASRDIEVLNREIKEIEIKLNSYLEQYKLSDYRELLVATRKLQSYKVYQEEVKLKLEQKKKILSEENYQQLKETLSRNSTFLDKIIKYSNCKNIDEVIGIVEFYQKKQSQLENIEQDINNKQKTNAIYNENLKSKEYEIQEQLKLLRIEVDSLVDLEIYIKQYSEKIENYQQIKNNLNSIEETYKVLLKDRDIEAIKNELQDIITEKNPYTFKSEEEVEFEEKKKANELIDYEKSIKDLQNNINTRLIGKRDIVTIEEELAEVSENIKRDNKKVVSIEMALDTLKLSFNEVRGQIGPQINQKIKENFERLTNKKYNDVLLAEDYQMMVRDQNNIFKGAYLSNGALDQLYLSLRMAIIELIFNDEECPLILDDALTQYDDKRRREAILLLSYKHSKQLIIFTCQKKEEEILKVEGIEAKFLYLTD